MWGDGPEFGWHKLMVGKGTQHAGGDYWMEQNEKEEAS